MAISINSEVNTILELIYAWFLFLLPKILCTLPCFYCKAPKKDTPALSHGSTATPINHRRCHLMQTARGVYSSALGPDSWLTQESRSQVPSRKSCRFIKAETTHREGSQMKGKRGTKLPGNFKGGLGLLITYNMFHNVLQQGIDSGQ